MSRSRLAEDLAGAYIGGMMSPSSGPLASTLVALACVAPACGDGPPAEATTAAQTATGQVTDTGTSTSSGPDVPTTGTVDTGDTGDTSDTDAGTTDATSTTGPAETTSTATTDASSSSGGEQVIFQDLYPLTAQWPEGGTYDPTDGVFYVGSLGDGAVRRVDATSGAETVVFTEDAPGTWWTLGMDVDVARRLLWVCAMDDSLDPRAGYIWIFDLNTGERVRAHALADAAPDATCTDVALTTDGRGYVGDREVGNMYVVDIDAGASMFTTSPDLEAAVVGQNSIVVLPDQSALLSLLYLPSGLSRIDLKTAAVVPVEIDGTFSDFAPLAGADGMTYVDGGLYVVFTSKLARVTPSSPDWSQATSVVEDIESGQTDVITTPGGLYLLNGQSVGFALGTRPDPFVLVRYLGAL